MASSRPAWSMASRLSARAMALRSLLRLPKLWHFHVTRTDPALGVQRADCRDIVLLERCTRRSHRQSALIFSRRSTCPGGDLKIYTKFGDSCRTKKRAIASPLILAMVHDV